MAMVMTVLEAHVAPERWGDLEAAYREGIKALEPGLVQTFLVRGAADPTLCRILTLWESRAALDAMRATGETPKGVLFFRAAGAEPTLSIFGVAQHAGVPAAP